MYSILSRNGYGILKSALSEKELENIKKDLTMVPRVNFDMGAGASNSPEDLSFQLYNENDKRIYIPRYYGFQKYGLPSLCKLTGGADIDVKFIGSLREAQQEPIANFLKAANDPLKMGGIISVPCGFGKTIMSLYIACALKKKTIFISHKDFLNQQFTDTVAQFAPEAKVGIIKQKKVDVAGKDFIVASLQSLAMRDYDESIFDDIGFVIIDEVHHTGAQVFCKAFRKLNNPIILGLSATLNRKDGMRKVFEYYIGKSVYTLKNKEFCDVKVQIHKYFETHIDYSTVKLMWNGKENGAGMINNVCSFMPRTQFIISLLIDILSKEPDRRVLILSERRNQLKDIEKFIVEYKICADATAATTGYGYYVGGMKQTDLAISAEKQIILATYQLAAEGFNVPSLNTVIFASPISDIQQSIGRILREPPEKRKYTPLCIDILDDFSIFKRKGAARLKFYNNNKYRVSYYVDNQEIESEENVAASAGANDNDEDAGDAGCDADFKKKLRFIEED
uniref:Helicase ATP-binding domain-containing protein n=1 Tax=viral metagenome TaxID=1070528 RepID=A0A6C0K6V7_9ZZZZ